MLSELSQALLFAAFVIWVYMSIWFIVSIVIKRNDVADAAWGLGFVVTGITSYIHIQNSSFTANLATMLVVIWGVRLSWHIGRRNLKKSEDYRYKLYRDTWGKWFVIRSYFQIYILQGVFMILIVSPVLLIYTYSMDGILPLALMGALVWLFGFLFESIGDKQLKKFISNPKNTGHVMQSGLWQYTRHPNYFGEVTQWWGIAIIALTCDFGWLGLVGPLVITWLIVRVSGVPLLEDKYASNPEYQAYKRKTSVLIPLPSKK